MDETHDPHEESGINSPKESIPKERIHNVVASYGKGHYQKNVKPMQETQASGPDTQPYPIFAGGSKISASQTGTHRTHIYEAFHSEGANLAVFVHGGGCHPQAAIATRPRHLRVLPEQGSQRSLGFSDIHHRLEIPPGNDGITRLPGLGSFHIVDACQRVAAIHRGIKVFGRNLNIRCAMAEPVAQ